MRPRGYRQKDIIKKLDEHILGQTNETFERYKLNTKAQNCDESIDSYVAALKILMKTCNFCECLKQSLLRDRIVFGIRDDLTRKRLLQERNLDLSRCIDICRTHENTTSQMKMIGDVTEDVHRVEERPPSVKKQQNYSHQNLYEQLTRPIMNDSQHGPLLIANSADEVIKGRRRCVRHWARFAARVTIAITSRDAAHLKADRECMSLTISRQTGIMTLMETTSWQCIRTNRFTASQMDPSTPRWCYRIERQFNCRLIRGQQ